MNTKERLKFVREYLGGISQQRLADELGCKKTTIASIETGTQKTPPYDLALMLNNRYGFSVQWFMKGDEPKFDIQKNTLKRLPQNPEKLRTEIKNWGKRLEFIRTQNKMTNNEFARLLNMKLERFLDICLNSKEPTIKELIGIKTNFDVQLDYLLFGEDNVFYEDNSCQVVKETSDYKLTPEEFAKLKKLLGDE